MTKNDLQNTTQKTKDLICIFDINEINCIEEKFYIKKTYFDE